MNLQVARLDYEIEACFPVTGALLTRACMHVWRRLGILSERMDDDAQHVANHTQTRDWRHTDAILRLSIYLVSERSYSNAISTADTRDKKAVVCGLLWFTV